MSSGLKPKGRNSLPTELLQFGRHLVYAEGTKTEPYYIESIKKEIAEKYHCEQNDLQIIPAGDGTSYNTTGLVKFVMKDVSRRLKEEEKIDHVWIFFDKDDFPHARFLHAHEMIEKMNDSKIKNNDGFRYDTTTNISWHSCFSNEAFELWYCLYFGFYSEPHNRKEYITCLNQKLKHSQYSKTRKDMHQFLVSHGGNVKKAIQYAKKLPGAKTRENPSTGVYQFVEYFLAYMDHKKSFMIKKNK